jgi:zinc transport system substrate-binding protein
VLAEPQFNRRLIATVLERTDTNKGVIYPFGVRLEKGPALYPQLIRNMAKTLVGCLLSVKVYQLAQRRAD